MYLTFFWNVLMNFNPLNLILNLTFLISCSLFQTYFLYNIKFSVMVLLMFFIGGMMMFIAMISSILKYFNKSSYQTNMSLLILMGLFILMMNFMSGSNMMMFIHFEMFQFFFIILIMLSQSALLTNIMNKTQKSLKFYVDEYYIKFFHE